MSNFQRGDRVTFGKNAIAIINEKDMTGKIGIVRKTFDNIPIVLVEFDGEICKIPEFGLEKAPDPKPAEAEKSKERVEISREEFHDLAIKFTSLKYLEDLFEGEDMEDDAIVEFASVAAVVVDNLENQIFGDHS